MQRIISHLNTTSDSFKINREHNLKLQSELKDKLHKTRFDRPERDIERLKRQDKMFVRDRLELLLDPNTPFLELSSLAANRAYDGMAPSAGVITGIGIVNGREVMIHANDSSVKGGAWFPLTVKKIIRMLDIAIENRLPVIHLCDSAGGFLPLQSKFFADKYHGGRVFRNQCTLSKMGIPQVSVVLGHCTAGGAYVPALSEYSVIVRGTGAIFLGGPPLVKAATGEVISADALGGCDLHTQTSGTSDYPADSEAEAIAKAREIVAQFPSHPKEQIEQQPVEAPYYDPEELYGIIPPDHKIQYDVRELIARIVDGSRFSEYQPAYGSTLVCGFAHIWGYKIGLLGNNGVLFNDSALKGAHFIQLCNQSRIPLVFLQNITGFMVGREYEQKGITKDGAKMIMAQACSTVPKFTVMVGGSFGAGNYGMCGRAFDSRFLFSWPNSKISVMGGEQAAGVLTDIKLAQMKKEGVSLTAEEIDAIREPILEEYEKESDAYHATSEIWDDGLIDPLDTRNSLGVAISASLNSPIESPNYGIFRF